ncbi:glycoside hydrolase family 28 protein [Hebeloma cylindrosporum]|uniref:Glycoside hydrolase family 28 protein n=1 Tax=Hebeloma cylindrosporum TaxID=76867 RepID=A0A0C2Z1U3_HEBCY|nr:glycoside hydrolase family 28 protein [Hebeloma cylindrosporum h7]
MLRGFSAPFLLLLYGVSLVAAATLQLYEPAPIYPRSGYWTMTVDGEPVAVTAFDGYSYAHFSFGGGPARIRLVANQHGDIQTIVSSPVKYKYQETYTKSGNALGFTMENPHYMIIRLPGGYRPIVICADPLETNAPASSGSGIFNVVTQFGADKSGNSLSTDAFVNALRAAKANGGGIVYVPAGVYPIGNLIIPSKISLYLAAGSVLKFTGNRADYRTDWHKTSQDRDGTEWIRTAYNTEDIKIYGRGTIDANGEYASKEGKFIAHSVVPIATTRFTFDGPIIRHSASWTLMVTRSNNIMIDHAKILNSLSLGENDAVDIVDSQHVIVKNSIGIAWDDSFSTKAQPQGVGITINYPGENQPAYNVTFLDNLAWTGCYGFKVGQGVYKTQSNIRFERGTIYSASIAMGIDHAAGNAPVTDISFTGMEIEEVTGLHLGKQTWLAMSISNGGTKVGAGPINDIHIWDIAVRDIGSTNAPLVGLDSGSGRIEGVTFRNIWLKSLDRPARNLDEIKVTTTFATDVKLVG